MKTHSKGTDAYKREFHVNPRLTIWIDRLDWLPYFESPVGTPSLGQSQDLLIIKSIRKVTAVKTGKGKISGCMIPYDGKVQTAGQLIQIAESFQENDQVGAGRKALNPRIFLAIPSDAIQEINLGNIYQVGDVFIYFHEWM